MTAHRILRILNEYDPELRLMLRAYMGSERWLRGNREIVLFTLVWTQRPPLFRLTLRHFISRVRSATQKTNQGKVK